MADVPVISLDPYLLAVQATLLLLQQLGLIPDLNPLDYIIGAFDGKPKLEDTELAALRLQASPWWPLRALGNNLQIWVRNGVPLSTGIAADRQELSQWIQGTMDSLEPIVFNRFEPGSLNHAIWLAMTSQFGDQAIVQLNNEIANQRALGPLPTPPPPPPPPPPEPIEVPWHRTRTGDELSDLGDTLVAQNSLIWDTLQAILNNLRSDTTGDCCTKVVTAIGAIAMGLSAIATAVSGAGDAGALASAIATIAGAINSLAPLLQQIATAESAETGGTGGTAVDLQPLVDRINALGAVLNNFEICVCNWLKANQATTDANDAKARALVQYWNSLGIGDPQVNQILLS